MDRENPNSPSKRGRGGRNIRGGRGRRGGRNTRGRSRNDDPAYRGHRIVQRPVQVQQSFIRQMGKCFKFVIFVAIAMVDKYS